VAEDKKKSGNLLFKAIAGVFTLVVAPILVAVGVKFADPSNWKAAPATAANKDNTAGKDHQPQKDKTLVAALRDKVASRPEHKGAAEPQEVGDKPDPVISFVRPSLSDSFYTYALYPGRSGGQPAHKDPADPLVYGFDAATAALHTPGQLIGGLFTKKLYSNYTLIVEYRWGNPTPGKPFHQAAIHMHATGTDGEYKEPWMQAVACLLSDGETGSLQLLGDPGKIKASAKVKETLAAGRLRRAFDPAAPTKPLSSSERGWDNVVHRADVAVPAPPDGWNKLEIDCKADSISVRANGQPVNEITGLTKPQTQGRIVLTSELSEIYFRKVDLEPMRK
jgi:hypothetical protein